MLNLPELSTQRGDDWPGVISLTRYCRRNILIQYNVLERQHFLNCEQDGAPFLRLPRYLTTAMPLECILWPVQVRPRCDTHQNGT